MTCISQNAATRRMHEIRASGAIDYMNLQPKIEAAKEVIIKSLPDSSNPVVAYSGGKDSVVVLDLVRGVNRDIQGVFCNTGNEYPETVEFIETVDNIVWLTSRKTFWQCVKEYGMPATKSKAKSHGNQCCIWLKEKPATEYYKEHDVDLVFTGLTMDESRNRMMMLKRMGNYYLHKKENRFKCHPIHDWTEKEVWTYIKWRKLTYNPIYDLGIKRCGCRFCTAYISWKDMTSLYNVKDTKLLLRKLGQDNLDKWTR